jgi:serine/threonine-protein kinase
MEYLEGEDLAARMEHEAPMAPSAIADLIIPIVSALSAAHEAGIVHRDLKPENVFITRGKGGALEPKLVDFGISKLQGEALHLTGTNAILGTPYYMSPEQAGSSKHVDHRSDIFSLGVILYQCVTHELPFKGDSLYQLLGEIMHKEPPQVSTLAEGIAPAFEAVIVRAMQKDPARRFQSAADLGAALLPFASARVRLLYEPELLAAARALPGSGLDAGSTLGPTTGEVRPRRTQRGRVLIGLGALLVLAGITLWLRSMHAPQAVAVAVAPSAQPAAAPREEVERSVAAPEIAADVKDAGVHAAAGLELPNGVADPIGGESTNASTIAGTGKGTGKGTSSSVARGHRGARVVRDDAQAAESAAKPAAAAVPEPAAHVAAPAGDDLFRDRK